MADKYVFLDRDGVINKDPKGWTEYSYVTRWEDFHFLPGVLEALEELSLSGYKSVIISNQQGVGKGYFTEEALNNITGKMIKTIEEAGGSVAGVYYCIHAKEEGCDCRKPDSGLFLKAQKELGIESLADMFYIGDTERDIQAGKKAGLKTVLALSGKSSQKDAEQWQWKPDYICKDLLEAVKLVID